MIATQQHYICIYEKVTSSNDRLIARYPVYEYRHKIMAVGWFDNASFSLRLAPTLADLAIDGTSGWLGNRVAVFVDNPNQPIWEGFINSVEVGRGTQVQRISLDEMYNRVSATRSTRVGGVSTTVNTVDVNTPGNVTASQSVYGIKQGNVETYVNYGLTTNTKYNLVRDMVLATQAWPQVTYSEGDIQRGVVRIECLGFWHTLAWETYVNAPSSGDENLSVALTSIVGAIANGTTFFNNADTTEITANAAAVTRRFGRGNQTVMQWLQGIQEAGDGTNYWIMGLTPPRYSLGVNANPSPTRRFYYRPYNTAITYTARLADNLRPRNVYGRLVQPWAVVPDGYVRIVDELINWNGTGDDPREFYVDAIDYEADSKKVMLIGIENKTVEGVMRFRRMNNVAGKRFGAPLRTYEGVT